MDPGLRARLDSCWPDNSALPSLDTQKATQSEYLGTYAINGWLAYIGLGGWANFYCGLDLTNAPPGTSLAQHGYRHIRQGHGQDYENTRQRIRAEVFGIDQELPWDDWKSFMDYTTMAVYARDNLTPQGAQDCRSWLTTFSNHSTGQFYAIGIVVITQKAGGFFNDDTLGTSYPSRSGCATVNAEPRGEGPTPNGEVVDCMPGSCSTDFGSKGLLVGSHGNPNVWLSPSSGSKWREFGRSSGALGNPLGTTDCSLRERGCVSRFQSGLIYESQAGTYPTYGAIGDKYASLGWENGRLGFPTSNEVCGLRGGGCYQNFQGGALLFSPSTGVHTSWGDIRTRYAQSGFENGLLGYPSGDEFCGLKDGGCGQHFQGGSIYWSPSSGPQVIRGAIRERWASLGWENSWLGYPVGEENGSFEGNQIGQMFQHYTAIIFNPANLHVCTNDFKSNPEAPIC